MKKLIFTSFIATTLSASAAFGQAPVPDSDTVATPVQQGDPAIRTQPAGLDYVEDRRAIQQEEMPDKVRHALESNEQYTGWKTAQFFHETNRDEYIIEFRDREEGKTFRFTKEGKPILEK